MKRLQPFDAAWNDAGSIMHVASLRRQHACQCTMSHICVLILGYVSITTISSITTHCVNTSRCHKTISHLKLPHTLQGLHIPIKKQLFHSRAL
jgi:hypothetical protein